MREIPHTKVPCPGGSGLTPTGVLQFDGDWPGLFIRGDDCNTLISAISCLTGELNTERMAGVLRYLNMIKEMAEATYDPTALD